MTKSGCGSLPDAIIARYAAHWPVGTKQRLALDLLHFNGQRRGDIVVMGPGHVEGSGVAVAQQKTRARLWIPIHRSLRESIDAFAAARAGGHAGARAAVAATTFLVTDYGRPFTAAGFGARFKDWRRSAGVEGYSAHELRRAAGRRLAEAGATAHQIMASLGHKSLTEAARYTADADQRRNARAAIDKLG